MAEEIQIQIKTAIDTANSAQKVGQLKNSLVELQNLAENSDLGAEKQREIQEAITQTTAKMANLTEKVGDIRDKVKTLDGSPVERLNNSFGLLGDGVRNLDFGKVVTGLKGIGMAVAANPLGLLLTTITTLMVTFGGFDKIVSIVTGSINNLNVAKDTLNKIGNDAIDGYGKEKVALEELFEPLNDVTLSSEQKKNIITDINKKYGEYLPNLLTEKSTNKELADAYDLVNASLIRKSITQAKVAALEEATTKRLKEVLAAEQRRAGLIQQGNNEVFIRETINNQLKASEEIYNSNIKAINDASKSLEKQLGITDDLGKKIDDQKEKYKSSNVQKVNSDNTTANNKKKITDDNLKKDLENQKIAYEALKNRLASEIDSIKINQQDKIAIFNQEFLDGKISYETLQAEKVLIEKEGNEAIIKVRDDFRLTDAEKLKIGLDNYKKLTDENQKEISSLTAANTEIDINLKKGVNEYELKTAQETADYKEKLIKDEADAQLKLAEDKKEYAKEQKKLSDEKLDKELQNLQFLQSATQQVSSALIGFSDAIFKNKTNNLKKGSKEEEAVLKKQFQVNKALSLSSAVVTGILSTMEAYKNGMKNPVPLLGPATAAVYAGLAALTSAASIAKIASTTFESKSISGGGGDKSVSLPSGPSNTETPTFTPTSFFGLGQNSQFNPQEQGPTRVYVTEGDISNTQNRVRVVENRARFG